MLATPPRLVGVSRSASCTPAVDREFAFRFNRRHSPSRGSLLFYRLLELAVQAPPRPNVSILANPGHKKRVKPAVP